MGRRASRRPPPRRIAAINRSSGASLSRNPLAPGAERLVDVFVEVERRQDDDPGRIARAVEDPTRRLETVHRSASGCPSARRRSGARRTASTASRPSPASATIDDVGLRPQDHPEAGPDQSLVVDEDDPDRHVDARLQRQAGADHETATRRDVGLEPDRRRARPVRACRSARGRPVRLRAAPTPVSAISSDSGPHRVPDRAPLAVAGPAWASAFVSAFLDDPVRRQVDARRQVDRRALDRELDRADPAARTRSTSASTWRRLGGGDRSTPSSDCRSTPTRRRISATPASRSPRWHRAPRAPPPGRCAASRVRPAPARRRRRSSARRRRAARGRSAPARRRRRRPHPRPRALPGRSRARDETHRQAGQPGSAQQQERHRGVGRLRGRDRARGRDRRRPGARSGLRPPRPMARLPDA